MIRRILESVLFVKLVMIAMTSALVVTVVSTVVANGPVAAVGLYWLQNSDPTVLPGVNAPLNQLLFRTDVPSIYYKSGAANTAWTLLGSSSAAAGTITGSGTTNTIPKFTAPTILGNSSVTDDSTTFSVNGKLSVTEATGIVDITNGGTSAALTITSGTGGGGRAISMRAGAALEDPSLIRWYKSDGTTQLWNMGNNSTVGSVTHDWYLFDFTNSFYNLYFNPTGTVAGSDASFIRFGLTDGRIKYDNTTHDMTIATNAITRATIGDTTANFLGALQEAGARVFSIAGAGLTSTGATVDVAATVGGGLTANPNDLQMSFCGPSQVPAMNGGGTAWGCATPSSATIGGAITAPGVVYASGANTAATDETAFTWNAVNNSLYIGTSAVTGAGATALNVSQSLAGGTPMSIWSTDTSGYSGIAFDDTTASYQSSIGYGNSAVALTNLRGLNFLASGTADWVFTDTLASGNIAARMFITNGSAGMQFANGSSGAVGAASTGKLRYNSTSQTFQASNNGAAFADVVTSGVAVNVIPKSGSSTTHALATSLLTDNATTLAYNTSSFTVNTSGNGSFAGTLDSIGALSENSARVFSVAGTGLTSSTSTVNAIALAGGGLTANADSLQMTFCAANQIDQMNAGGTAWACANAPTGTVTGSGTTNTMAKFTSASAVGNSSVTDDGTTFAINTNKFTVTESNGDAALAGFLNAVRTITVSATGELSYYGASTFSGTTGDGATASLVTTGTFDTTAGVLGSFGVKAQSTSTRSAGANALTNYAIYSTASGAQANYSFYGVAGDLFNAGSAVINGTTNSVGALTENSVRVFSVAGNGLTSTNATVQVVGTTGGGLTVSSDSVGLLTTCSAGQALSWDGSAWVCGTIYPWFGDGSDGALVFDGAATVLGMVPAGNVYTLDRILNATTISISAGVTLDASSVGDLRATGLITGTGTSIILRTPGDGQDGTVGGGGAGGLLTVGGRGVIFNGGFQGGAGGFAGAGSSASSNANLYDGDVPTLPTGAAGGAGVGGGAGAGGGAAVFTSASFSVKGGYKAASQCGPAVSSASNPCIGLQWVGFGGGGGGGATAAGGGGGGATGKLMRISAGGGITGNPIIRCKGGAGGNGFTGAGGASGGGGGGGSGGAFFFFRPSTAAATFTFDGAGGAGGTPGTGATAGGAGTDTSADVFQYSVPY